MGGNIVSKLEIKREEGRGEFGGKRPGRKGRRTIFFLFLGGGKQISDSLYMLIYDYMNSFFYIIQRTNFQRTHDMKEKNI